MGKEISDSDYRLLVSIKMDRLVRDSQDSFQSLVESLDFLSKKYDEAWLSYKELLERETNWQQYQTGSDFEKTEELKNTVELYRYKVNSFRKAEKQFYSYLSQIEGFMGEIGKEFNFPEFN